MRLAILVSLLASAAAFTNFFHSPEASSTKLDMSSRREILGSLAVGFFLPASAANAFSQQLSDYAYEPQQQATNGKLDLNAAFVVSSFFVFFFRIVTWRIHFINY